MEVNRKRAKVHRLPTGVTHESPSYIYIDRFNNDKLTYDSHQSKEHHDCTYFHLYFTTDEEIKEGDWYLYNGGVHKCPHSMMGNENPKIVASTDPKLIAEGVAQPSQDFIKAYCEQGGIDEVDVEYEYVRKGIRCMKFDISEQDSKCESICNYCFQARGVATGNKLKVDPIHNTITTHRIVEKKYSIDDIEAYCDKYPNDAELGREIRKLRYKQ